MANSRVEGLDRRLLLLTAAYGLFLIGLIVVANSGRAIPQLLSVVRSVPGGDKTVHFVLGGTMALLLNLSLRAAHWRLGPLAIQKGSVLVVLLGLVTLVPSLVLYSLSILFSPSIDTIAQTLPVAGTIEAAV